MERDDLHIGLNVAETKAALRLTAMQMLTRWAMNGIANFRIPVGSSNYEKLLDAPEIFEVTDPEELCEYYALILRECKKNGEG